MTLGRRFAIALIMLIALGSFALVGAASVLHLGRPGVLVPRVTAGSSTSGPGNTIWE